MIGQRGAEDFASRRAADDVRSAVGGHQLTQRLLDFVQLWRAEDDDEGVLGIKVRQRRYGPAGRR